MEIHMSAEVLDGLERARKAAVKRSSRLRVVAEDQVFAVSRSWDGGFALSSDAPHLRGTVEFCDGSKLLYECLIVCSALEGREMVYEYKRMTKATEGRILDFVQADDAPVALLTK
jgi:hypothetical protein